MNLVVVTFAFKCILSTHSQHYANAYHANKESGQCDKPLEGVSQIGQTQGAPQTGRR